jgi:diphosphomevalonate decarboxylase
MLDYKNSKLIVDTSSADAGKVLWQSPSNLAIVKYWGKHGVQLPRNPSLSFTLANCFTQTLLEYEPKDYPSNEIELEMFFHGEQNEKFQAKTLAFLNSVVDIFPFLRQFKLKMNTGNSFPHSSGIASSASGMSALALCLCTMEDRFFGTLSENNDFDQKASYIARLGSGSACRSIFPYMSAWGKTSAIAGSSDEYGVAYESEIHDVFKGYHNAILIASSEEKSVSSRAGHALMEDNIYAASRYQQANQRMNSLVDILKAGDTNAFGQLAENEAMSLHALMMASTPSYTLMRPNTLSMIEEIRRYREETKHPVYFSLDAGPNIHLLYPDDCKEEVQLLIDNQLLKYCQNGIWIKDWIGEGPEEL